MLTNYELHPKEDFGEMHKISLFFYASCTMQQSFLAVFGALVLGGGEEMRLLADFWEEFIEVLTIA